MVSVVDELPQGLSAVYTFYDPTQTRRSLGVHGVLALVEECRRRKLPWLYLGYWIKECDKMSYKDRFRPLQAYLGGRWQVLDEATPPSHARIEARVRGRLQSFAFAPRRPLRGCGP